jgi:IPT/TIG domain
MQSQRKQVCCSPKLETGTGRGIRLNHAAKWGFVLLPLLLASLLLAQSAPKVNTVDPTSGKVNDNVTLTGENLGKDNVAAVNLSDADSDFQATVVEQGSDKIVMKVPQVKAGDYNVSIQVKDRILILPLRFTVTE